MAKMKELVIDILEMYERGYSVREIADLHGLRQETVVSVLEDWGVTPAFFA